MVEARRRLGADVDGHEVKSGRREQIRLLGDLARGRVVRQRGSGEVDYVVSSDDQNRAGKGRPVSRDDVAALLASGAIVSVGDHVRLTKEGLAAFRRAKSGGESFLDQHRDLVRSTVSVEQGLSAPLANANESPLSWLRARKSKTGEPLIAATEFEAGLRLAADFYAAGHQPRVTASWEPAGSPNRRRFGGRRRPDPSISALDARQRLKRALDSTGPDMARLLVDVCCLETGLTDIEKRRNWPRRSARIVLRIGLGILARHYGLTNERGPDVLADHSELADGVRQTAREVG